MQTAAEITREVESPKRQAILAAASDLFVAQGYGAVSMDAVARGASVSKATLYAHFASKDVLFTAIIKEACQEGMPVGEFSPASDLDIETALTGLGRRILSFLMEPRALAIHRVVMAESARFPELGRAFFQGGPTTFRRTFGEWLARQQEVGRLQVDDPQMAADQFVGMLKSGIYTLATLGMVAPPWDAEIDATVRAAVRTFLRAYAVC